MTYCIACSVGCESGSAFKYHSNKLQIFSRENYQVTQVPKAWKMVVKLVVCVSVICI